MQITDPTGVKRGIVDVRVIDGGGILRELQGIAVRDATGLRSVFSTLAAAASPTSVQGHGRSPGGINVSTAATTLIGTGGVAPYTFSWAGPGAPWSVGSPSSASTQFICGPLYPSDAISTTFTGTVTDATGKTATAACNAYASNDYFEDFR